MSLLYILLALMVLLIMITVHEFGHYVAGKIFGFKINEFSIGFGPAIYKKTKKNGELFSVRALPLGGYCAFEGEDEDGNDKPGAFNTMPAWKRIIVLLAGVTFNFLFGVLSGAIYLFVVGYATPKLTSVVSVSNTNLEQNDIIIAVDGKTIENYRSFDSLVANYDNNEEFVVTVNRDGQIIDVKSKKSTVPAHYVIIDLGYFKNKFYDASGEAVEPLVVAQTLAEYSITESQEIEGTGESLQTLFDTYFKDEELQTKYSLEEIKKFVTDGKIKYIGDGVGIGITYTYNQEKYTLFESLGKSWPFCFYLCKTILGALGGLFTGATAVKDMGGTVTAVSQIAEISQMGIEYFLLLLPLLAMNLAVFNVLPIPALDGARALFVLIELIFRKPVPRKIEGWIHTVGLFLLLGLVVFFDIYHFASFKNILFKRLL